MSKIQTDQKTIWIINQYATTPSTGIGGRHYYLARGLLDAGYQVCVVAASYTHLMRNPPVTAGRYTFEMVDGVQYVWVKSMKYEQAHSKTRVLNWFLFAWKLRGLLKTALPKPDFILYSSPSLVAFNGARYLSRRYNAKLIFEVRDIWPLTLTELGGYSSKGLFVKYLQSIEDGAYRDSIKVLSNLPNAVEHMVSRGMVPEKFHWVPNGYSTKDVSKAEPLSPARLAEFPDSKFVIGYAGTMGLANALEVLINAAKLLASFDDIVFVFVGDGRDKKRLQQIAYTLGLVNVRFLDPVPKMQVQSMLSRFDVCYLGWRNDALYRFGIAPNKLPEYMFASKPIIHSYSGYGDLVAASGAGLSVPAEDSAAVAEAVLALYRAPASLREDMGLRGRNYVLQHNEYGELAAQLDRSLRALEHDND